MYVELDIGDKMVICRPPNWEVVVINKVNVGDMCYLSQYPPSLRI